MTVIEAVAIVANLPGEEMAAGHIKVFAMTNQFGQDVVAGRVSASARLTPATNDSGRIVRTVLILVRGCDPITRGASGRRPW